MFGKKQPSQGMDSFLTLVDLGVGAILVAFLEKSSRNTKITHQSWKSFPDIKETFCEENTCLHFHATVAFSVAIVL